MYSIMRTFVWLRRWRHFRGFGVQSPWVYRFIRYVVNECYPYYSYDELACRWKNTSRKERKLGMLYFRLSNYMQSPFVIDYSTNCRQFADYVRSGCNKTEVFEIPQCSTSVEICSALSRHETIPFLRVSTQGCYRTIFFEVLPKAGRKSMFVIEGINKDKAAKDFWKEIVALDRCITTFDLYYCGIIFFDNRRYKENYIVNF